MEQLERVFPRMFCVGSDKGWLVLVPMIESLSMEVLVGLKLEVKKYFCVGL